MRLILIILLLPNLLLAQKTDTLKIGKTTYVGVITNGKLNGKGREYYKGELSYEGDFLNTERHGIGKAYINDLIEEGYWEHGVLVKGKSYIKGSGMTYEGIWNNGELVNGRIQYPNGCILNTSTRKLKPDGKGVMEYPDGTKVESNYRNGKPHGNAIIYYKTGKVVKGIWKRTKSMDLTLFIEESGTERKVLLTNGDPIQLIKG